MQLPLSLIRALFVHVAALAEVLGLPLTSAIGRAWWGVELVEAGKVACIYQGLTGTWLYEVESRSGDEPHLVLWNDRVDGWVCSCPDYLHRHAPCAHICAVELLWQATHQKA